MKLLLTILGSLSVGSTPALAPIATNPSFNQNLSTNPQAAIWEAPTSMVALQNGMDHQWMKDSNGERFESDISSWVQTNYNRAISDRQGLISITSIHPLTETVERTFEETFTNDTAHEQTFKTHGYTQQFANSATFSSQLKEDISVQVKASFMFGGIAVTGSFSSTQTWTSTESITETVTAPSQDFVVAAHNRGIVTYLIKSGTNDINGLIRYEVPLDQGLYTSNIWGDKEPIKTYKISEIIHYLNDAGYGSMIDLNSEKFSIISTDNPENPSVAYLNIPISYISKAGKLDVTFTEEPLI